LKVSVERVDGEALIRGKREGRLDAVVVELQPLVGLIDDQGDDQGRCPEPGWISPQALVHLPPVFPAPLTTRSYYV
jgi:hypothetical protein